MILFSSPKPRIRLRADGKFYRVYKWATGYIECHGSITTTLVGPYDTAEEALQ